nr:TRAP transporter substrate-binding protein [Poseidonocella sp. HB161398]
MTLRLSLLLGASALAMPAQAEEHLTAIGTWSSVYIYQDFEKPFWEGTLSELTDGAFSGEISSLDQMGVAGPDVYRMLGDGVFDIGTTIADYAVGDAPELEGLDVPLLAMTPSEAHAMVDAARPMVADIFAERFYSHALGMLPHAPQVMFCRDEVASLDDLQGKKVRGSGRMTTKFLEALGAEGVNIAFSEVPGALERGVIDCAITGAGSGLSAGWWEVTDYLVTLPLGGWDTAVVAINQDRWDGLSPEQQEALQAAVTTGLEDRVWAAADGGLEQDLACLSGAEACEDPVGAEMALVDFSEADLEKVRSVLTGTVLPDWAERAGADWVARWNGSVGKVTGVAIAQ